MGHREGLLVVAEGFGIWGACCLCLVCCLCGGAKACASAGTEPALEEGTGPLPVYKIQRDTGNDVAQRMTRCCGWICAPLAVLPLAVAFFCLIVYGATEDIPNEQYHLDETCEEAEPLLDEYDCRYAGIVLDKDTQWQRDSGRESCVVSDTSPLSEDEPDLGQLICRTCVPVHADVDLLTAAECGRIEIGEPNFLKHFVSMRVLEEEECTNHVCRMAFKIQRTTNTIFNMNYADFILECVALPVSAIAFYIAWEHKEDLYSDDKKALPRNICTCLLFISNLIFFVDIAFQLVVVVVAFNGSAGGIAALKEAKIVNEEGMTVCVEMEEDFKSIRSLGILELIIALLGLGLDVAVTKAAMWQREPPFKNGIIASLTIVAIVFDFILATVDFWAFSVDLQEKWELMFAAMAGGSVGDINWCHASVAHNPGNC
jgi:hypothetical protein